MNIIDKIINEINYFGVPKKQRLDYYLKNMIKNKTNFEINKIDLLIAEKTRIKTYNEFNSFIFKYDGLTYHLLDDDLKIIYDYK